MTDNKNTNLEKSQDQKKQYVRPQLVTHGAVETLTQGVNRGPSGGQAY